MHTRLVDDECDGGHDKTHGRGQTIVDGVLGENSKRK